MLASVLHCAVSFHVAALPELTHIILCEDGKTKEGAKERESLDLSACPRA